jgi:hypothetical protein
MRWTAGILAVATGLVALGVLRPWDHKHEARRKHAKQEASGKDAKAAG